MERQPRYHFFFFLNLFQFFIQFIHVVYYITFPLRGNNHSFICPRFMFSDVHAINFRSSVWQKFLSWKIDTGQNIYNVTFLILKYILAIWSRESPKEFAFFTKERTDVFFFFFVQNDIKGCATLIFLILNFYEPCASYPRAISWIPALICGFELFGLTAEPFDFRGIPDFVTLWRPEMTLPPVTFTSLSAGSDELMHG